MPAVSGAVCLVFESTHHPGPWVSNKMRRMSYWDTHMAQMKRTAKINAFACEFIHKTRLQKLFLSKREWALMQTRGKHVKLQMPLIPPQPIISIKTNRSHDFNFWWLLQNCTMISINFTTKHRSYAQRMFNFKHQLSVGFFFCKVRQNFLFESHFHAFPYFKRPHVWSGQNKHQQGLVLPFRGFSSAAANQMMRRNKNMDFIFLHVRDWVSNAQ